MLWTVVILQVKHLEQRSIYNKDALKLYAYIRCTQIMDWALYLAEVNLTCPKTVLKSRFRYIGI